MSSIEERSKCGLLLMRSRSYKKMHILFIIKITISTLNMGPPIELN
jgi:hypothetical protein